MKEYDDLKRELKALDEQETTLDDMQKEFYRDEEELDDFITDALVNINRRMEKYASYEDESMYDSLVENENNLRAMRQHAVNYEDELKMYITTEKRKINEKRQFINEQINKLFEKKDEKGERK